MSDVLILNAGTASPIVLVVQSAGENAPIEVGSVTPSFNLVDRTSVRAIKRNYGSLTSFVSTAVKDSIINLLKYGRQIPCSGDLLGNIQTQCTVRYTGATMSPQIVDMWTVGLALNEVQPNNILLRYSPGDTITGESFIRSTTRNQIATATGLITSKAIDAKRDSHLASGLPTLLMEDARTNGLIRSEEFDNAAWTKAAATITANSAVAPDGASTSDALFETATTAEHLVFQGTTTTANTLQAHSVFAKAGSRTWMWLRTNLRDGTTPTTWINLATGAIGTKAAGHAVRVTALVSGWYRVEVVVNSGVGGGATAFLIGTATGDNVTSFLGVITAGINIWGAQHEQDKPFASSYIPTTTVAVAKTASTYSLPFTTPPQEMTVGVKFVESGTVASPAGTGLLEIGTLAGGEPLFLIYNPGGAYTVYHGEGSAGSVTSGLGVLPVIGDVVELTARLYGDGSVQISQSINGGAEVTATQSAAKALGTAWSAQTLFLNVYATTFIGFNAFASLKIVAGARSLAEMRAA